jgi:hypothetical protein
MNQLTKNGQAFALAEVEPEPETLSLINDCLGRAVGPCPHLIAGAGVVVDVVVVVAPPPCLLDEASSSAIGLGYPNE